MTLIDTVKAAEYLGVNEATLRNWRSMKKGPPFVRLGDTKKSAIRYSLEDLDLWLKKDTKPKHILRKSRQHK